MSRWSLGGASVAPEPDPMAEVRRELGVVLAELRYLRSAVDRMAARLDLGVEPVTAEGFEIRRAPTLAELGAGLGS